MAKILIDVPDEVYERLYTINPMDIADQITIDMAIKHGIVLDGLTNGEVIQKMFPNAKITEETYVVFANIEECNHPFDKAWWNRKWGE